MVRPPARCILALIAKGDDRRHVRVVTADPAATPNDCIDEARRPTPNSLGSWPEAGIHTISAEAAAAESPG
jgi:hypothetical protein